MKIRKLAFISFSLACFVAAGTCVIVDTAVNRRITWAAYPLLSLAFAWAVSLPLLAKKHVVLLSLGALTALLLPYLFLLSKLTPVTDWFVPIGLPSAIAGSAAAWLLLLLFRYTKINMWYKEAASVFLLVSVVSPVINYFVDLYTGDYPFAWDRLINVFAGIAAAGVLMVVGYTRSRTTPSAP